MNYIKPKQVVHALSFSLFIVLIHSCTVFESLNTLRKEADELLVNYPKTNYNSLHIDFSHTNESHSSQYSVLKNTLENYDRTFIEPPEADPDLEGDTPLLAALRQDIGILLLPELNQLLTPKELRALELFVIFGGRIITTAPPSARTSSAFSALLSKFKMGVTNDQFPPFPPMYFPETDRAGTDETFPERGHIMTLSRNDQQALYHEFDQIVMLFPKALAFEENSVFEHTVIASKTGDNTKVTVLKATSTVNTQPRKGSITVLGDSFISKAPVDGGTNNINQSSYQGGMITSGNFKFIVSTILESDIQGPDVIPPVLEVEFPANVDVGTDLVSPRGRIVDKGGVAKIDYILNESIVITPFDAFSESAQRRFVNGRVGAGLFIRIPEEQLRPGLNTITVTATDQALLTTTETYTFTYGLTGTGRSIEISSKNINLNETDLNMGVELSTGGNQIRNKATFGGKLSDSFWDGINEGIGCKSGLGDFLSPSPVMSSATAGAARIESMEMPLTEGVLNELGMPASLITFHFGPLRLNDNLLTVVNHAERRQYENTNNALLEIKIAGTTLITSNMPTMFLTVNHNASGNCNDDIITYTSARLPVSLLLRAPDLPANELRIANAILTDLDGVNALRFRGTVFNRIVHGANSDALIQGRIRYQLGVHHPDPGAINFEGFATIDFLN